MAMTIPSKKLEMKPPISHRSEKIALLEWQINRDAAATYRDKFGLILLYNK
jgi:hypothetical protein